MEQNKAEWLPHLSKEVVTDARGPEFDAYLVALEGWRRGLTLRWHTKDSEKFPEMKTWFVDKPGKLFSLKSTERIHYFFRTRGDKVPNEAVEAGADKEVTKKLFDKAGVPSPEGHRFTVNHSDDQVVNYVEKLGYPVVIKPTNGSFGRGVITNIQQETTLRQALVDLRTKAQEPDILVERHIDGEEYRLYVVGDEVAGAIHRIPANVTGDGQSTIQLLVDLKNEERAKNPRLISCPIKPNREMEEFLRASGYTLDSIPPEGKTIFLTNKSNISIGGDPVDVLDELPEEVKQTAVRALQAVPGLSHGAVDLMIEADKTNGNKAVVLELNPTAQIGSLVFPMAGKARDIPSAIMDYYFPETKEMGKDRSGFYFDFDGVLDPLVSKSATVSTVSPAPIGKVYATCYTVSGEVQGIDYHRGLRKQAFERNLSGFVLSLSTGEIQVIVAGTDEEMVADFRQALLDDPERSVVEHIEERKWEEPIKVGFEVKADLRTQLDKLREMQARMEMVDQEYRRAEEQYRKYQKSLSWRLTFPLRTVSKAVKLFKR